MTGFPGSSRSERLPGALGAAIIVGLIGLVLLFGLVMETPERQATAITVVQVRAEVREERRPKPPVKRQVHVRAATAAAPRNLRSKAAPAVAPPPIVPPLMPPPLAVAMRAGEGMAASTGASDRPGEGAGAAGSGDGTGAGGTGEGDGDADDSPPRLIKGRLRYTDLSRDLRDSGIGGDVGVRYAVGGDGHVSACRVTRSSGSVALDEQTCALIERRFRYEPSRDAEGAPVESTIEEMHRWLIEAEPEQGR